VPATGGGPRDTALTAFLWRILVLSDRVVGVRRARALVSFLLRMATRLSDGIFTTTAHRLSPRLRDQNPRLVPFPERWSTEEPLVHVRRLGLELDLDLRDNLQALVYYTGVDEPAFARHLHQELRADDVYADVGAHVGIHALAAARQLARLGGGRVLAFEPAPDSVEKLRVAAECNDLAVYPVRRALSDRAGYLTLYSDQRYLSADAGVRSVHGHGEPVAVVPVTTFDEWAETRRLGRLDVVKIDVEGHEFSVLNGMRRSLARLRPRALYIELKDDSLGRAPVSDEELRAFVRELGYVSDGTVLDHNQLFRPASHAPGASAARAVAGQSRPGLR
jgi:FkbM family methyltransferase